MPSTKDFQNKKKKVRRRPGREEAEEQAHHEIVEETSTESAAPEVEASPAEEFVSEPQGPEASPERRKVHIEFPYSDLVRSKAPRVFEVAENVAEEWVNDGTFENIPVGHPLAQITVAAGLRKAKEVEKKLEEKGVFMMAKMGLEFAKSKLNRK